MDTRHNDKQQEDGQHKNDENIVECNCGALVHKKDILDDFVVRCINCTLDKPTEVVSRDMLSEFIAQELTPAEYASNAWGHLSGWEKYNIERALSVKLEELLKFYAVSE